MPWVFICSPTRFPGHTLGVCTELSSVGLFSSFSSVFLSTIYPYPRDSYMYYNYINTFVWDGVPNWRCVPEEFESTDRTSMQCDMLARAEPHSRYTVMHGYIVQAGPSLRLIALSSLKKVCQQMWLDSVHSILIQKYPMPISFYLM